MMPKVLWETTLNPRTRRLLRVEIDRSDRHRPRHQRADGQGCLGALPLHHGAGGRSRRTRRLTRQLSRHDLLHATSSAGELIVASQTPEAFDQPADPLGDRRLLQRAVGDAEVAAVGHPERRTRDDRDLVLANQPLGRATIGSSVGVRPAADSRTRRRRPAPSPAAPSADSSVDDDVADRRELADVGLAVRAADVAARRPRRPATRSAGRSRIVSWTLHHRRRQLLGIRPCSRSASRRSRTPSTASTSRSCARRRPANDARRHVTRRRRR